MDLAVIKTQLADLGTFGKYIGPAIAGIPGVIIGLVDFFKNIGDNAEVTSSIFK